MKIKKNGTIKIRKAYLHYADACLALHNANVLEEKFKKTFGLPDYFDADKYNYKINIKTYDVGAKFHTCIVNLIFKPI